MTDNDKDDPITDDYLADPTVGAGSYWYDDGENTYPLGVVTINGMMFDRDDAREVHDQLGEVLRE